jgi:hypothetical protein
VEETLKKLSKVTAFDRVYLETDVDPEDESTPGWTAGVRIDESEMEPDGIGFIGFYSENPSNAVEGLVGELLEKEYITNEDL